MIFILVSLWPLYFSAYVHFYRIFSFILGTVIRSNPTRLPDQRTVTYRSVISTFINRHLGWYRWGFSRFSRSTVAPAGVTITGPTEAKAGDQVLITCTTENSNPPADIKWTVDGRNSESNASKTELAPNGGWITSSNVTFSINHKSRSIVVICHASNVKLTENVVGTHTINVICEYPPLPPTVPYTHAYANVRFPLSQAFHRSLGSAIYGDWYIGQS